MFDFVIAGVQVSPVLLIFTGFTVGVVGGFIGVGGGYMVTPALIVFGFPGYMAAGIDMTHIAGKGLISMIRHRAMGNVDWTLALVMTSGTMAGVELGIRLLDYFKERGLSTAAVLTGSLVVMLAMFAYTQLETRRSHKYMAQQIKEGQRLARDQVVSRLPLFFQSLTIGPIVRCRTAGLSISLWVIMLIGILTGLLAGFLGVGGGFIRVPALVYMVGASTHVAVGTDLVEIIFSGGYGAARHTMQGNVDFVAVMFLICGAVFGSQLGSIATAYVRGPAIRYVLSYSLLLAAGGSAIRLIDALTEGAVPLLKPIAVILTLGEMVFLCGLILSLVWLAVRHKRGCSVPGWAIPLVISPHTDNASRSSQAAGV